MKKKSVQRSWFLIVLILIGIGVIILFGVIRVLGAFNGGKARIITSSTLMDAIDISELSTAQFTYNGIAEVKSEKTGKIKYYIRYNAKVKAGIDMKKVEFEIDEDEKIIKPILPEIEILSNPVEEKSLSFIPNDAKMDLKDAISACKQDVINEAKESPKLFNSAEDNLRAIIEALLYPIVEPQGYSIIWE